MSNYYGVVSDRLSVDTVFVMQSLLKQSVG